MVPDRLAWASDTLSRHCICTASTRPAGFTTKWHVVPTNWYAARYLGFLARRAAGEGQFWRGSALGRAAFQTRETAESTRTTDPVTQSPYLIWPKVPFIGDRLGRAPYRGDFRLAPSSCSDSQRPKQRSTWGINPEAKAMASSEAPATSGTVMRTREPAVRPSTRASRTSRSFPRYSLAMILCLDWYQ